MNRKLLLATCLAAIFSSFVSAHFVSAEEPEMRAFLVGVAKYSKDGLPDLTYAENDMKVLGAELEKQGFNVTTMLGRDATCKRVNEALDKFVTELGDLEKTDVALFAFSGHGQQRQVEIDGRLTEDAFFCPVDALKDDPATLVSIGRLMDDVQKRSGSSQNLLLVDACRNNPAKGAKGMDGSTALNLGNKISVLYSSTGGMRSFEAAKVQHGLFTYILLEGLRGEAASRSGDVTWLNLASYVMDAVPARAAELLEDPTAEQRPNLIGNLVRQPVLARLEATPRVTRGGKFDEQALAKAIQLRNSNNFELSLNMLEGLVERFPENTRPFVERAKTFNSAGKHHSAIADGEAALKLDPKNIDALFVRGYAYSMLGDFTKSLADYNHSIELQPTNAYAYLQRCSVYGKMADYNRALADANKALELDASYASAFANRGYIYSCLNDSKNAMADFHKAIELNPQDVYSLCNRGREYSNAGNFDLAMADFNRSLEINPNFAESLVQRAHTYNKTGKYDLSIADSTRVIELNPKNLWGFRTRGHSYYNQSLWDRAIADYSKVIELAPNDWVAYNDRGRAYHSKGAGAYDLAIADYTKTLALNPNESSTLQGRARIYYQKLDYDSALADYSRCLSIAPNTASAWNERGNCHYVKADDTRAMSDYRKSCELDPSFESTFVTIGDLGAKTNKTYDRAIFYYTEAISRNPKNAAAYGGRAYAYHMLEQYGNAIKDYDKAIKYDPDNAKYKSNRAKAITARN